MESDPLNIGVIGFGRSAQTFHLPYIEKNEKLHFYSAVSSKKKQIQDTYKDVQVYSEIDGCLKDPNLDLVVITTPNHLHYPQTKAALLAGKHVIVEKPFVVDVQQGHELIELAKQRKKVLTVFQNRRWDGDFLTIQDLIKKNRLGQIRHFHSHFDRYRPKSRLERWREHDIPGAGLLYDLGVHLIDQMLQLFGLPTKVFADIACLRDQAVTDDYFHLIFTYEDAMRAHLQASCLTPHPSPRFVIHGDEATFEKWGLDPQEQLLTEQKMNDPHLWCELDIPGKLFYPNLKKETVETLIGDYAQFYEQLLQTLHGNQEVPVSAMDALNSILIIQACRESSKLGKIIDLHHLH